jgi:ribosomal protein S18 acetylase RimI-like enzyme
MVATNPDIPAPPNPHRRELFAALPPVPERVDIAGEPLDITPLKVGELPAFARAIQPVAASLSASPDWLALLADHGEAVIEAIAIASRRQRDWVASLDLDEAVRLAETVFRVNADFFIQRLLPCVTQAAARIGQTLERQTPGATPSNV